MFLSSVKLAVLVHMTINTPAFFFVGLATLEESQRGEIVEGLVRVLGVVGAPGDEAQDCVVRRSGVPG